MQKIKIVYETDDTEYEFIGNKIDTHGTGILFRSQEDDNTVIIGEVRFIHNEVYYCSESMTAMEGTFYYWTPVDKTVNKNSVLQDLIKELSDEQPEFETANNAGKMKSLIWDFGEQLRSWDKYGHNFKTADDAIDVIRAYFIHCINDYNLDSTYG